MHHSWTRTRSLCLAPGPALEPHAHTCGCPLANDLGPNSQTHQAASPSRPLDLVSWSSAGTRPRPSATVAASGKGSEGSKASRVASGLATREPPGAHRRVRPVRVVSLLRMLMVRSVVVRMRPSQPPGCELTGRKAAPGSPLDSSRSQLRVASGASRLVGPRRPPALPRARRHRLLPRALGCLPACS